MNKPSPLIFCIDDDIDFLVLLEQALTTEGYRAKTEKDPSKLFVRLENEKPDLILLDIAMPGMDGYSLCRKLREDKRFAYIPIIFLTGKEGEAYRSKAFSLGAAGYITKPFERAALLALIKSTVDTGSKWEVLRKSSRKSPGVDNNFDFLAFIETTIQKFNLPPGLISKDITQITNVFEKFQKEGLDGTLLSKLAADFTGVPYLPFVDPENVSLGILPIPFCRKNLVVPIGKEGEKPGVILCNPFDHELIELIKKRFGPNQPIDFFVSAPDVIRSFLDQEQSFSGITISIPDKKSRQMNILPPQTAVSIKVDVDDPPAVYSTNSILISAVKERASDIHLEPKKDELIVRLRIDGEMKQFMTVTKDTGKMVISRLKVIAGLDMTEKRRPQDGSFEAQVLGINFKFRIATTSTPYGESLIARLINPSAEHGDLKQLGMNQGQIAAIEDYLTRNQGLLLVVGPTGSGKTTTIYTLLNMMDLNKRSLISVEDPIEYTISHANQQEVNIKSGVTFETLLKSSVRQDPDILFIGEIRDNQSMKTAFDFTSTAHITISSLHTPNATTALQRMERLGASRDAMANNIICIVAQRLLKKLCPHCKKTGPPSAAEMKTMALFTTDLPAAVAHSPGCTQCNHTGFYGREAVYEILPFDGPIIDRIIGGEDSYSLRKFCKKNGYFLLGDHALSKIREGIYDVKTAYQNILGDDYKLYHASLPSFKQSQDSGGFSILIIDDDPDILLLISRILEVNGYRVVIAENAEQANIMIRQRSVDLILSDINMPGMDGFEFMEITKEMGLKIPFIFLTSNETIESEVKALTLGATDYIKKPIQKEILLARIKKALPDSDDIK